MRAVVNMKTLKRILTRLALVANVIFALLLFVCGWSAELNPAEYSRLSLMGLAFPLLLLINIGFIVFWLVFNIYYIWFPIVGMLCSFSYIYDYFPLNWNKKAPDGALKVMTYNNEYYGQAEKDEDGNYPVVDYMANSGADIICVQEGGFSKGLTARTVDEIMSAAGYRIRRIKDRKSEPQVVYSKLPVISVCRVPYESSTNGSVAVELLYDGDTVLVINNHFESYKLSVKDKEKYKEILNNPEGADTDDNTRALIRKMAKASSIRGPQVDSVFSYINKVGHDAVIVCGDFNDSPISYSCRRLSSRLTDVFRQSGCGLGWTYNQSGLNFRIDHIFVSDYWQSYSTYVDKTALWSDHYPLITYLKKRKK